ncbi:GYD domain-containing protein [Streptomyces sp. NBC_01264]|uniref:GYD domain-containing protein n=1 Tax=Streptomyces sp. NBC_01264 TaxID=2903804 RepID=UPI00224F72C7|nr:GYD domain-containing protein [Streptomyces sp. NBC_01264]MCX4781716.1 GYD domain-containing protein [Streptomyces sp. NBC_01264]
MPKYLIHITYTSEGLKGLLAEGGSGRQQAVEESLASVGGTLDAMYFALGQDDLYCLVDVPNQITMAALAMTARSSGAVVSKAVPLLSVAEVDEAARMAVGFRRPGA